MIEEPEDVSAEAWRSAIKCRESMLLTFDTFHAGHVAEAIARAIDTAVSAQRAEMMDLVDCLEDMTKHYVEARDDLFAFDGNEEIEVIAARKMIAAIRSQAKQKEPQT